MIPNTPIRMLHRLSRLYNAPAYVKSAEQEILDPTPDAMFADQDREYPIHTKAAAWYSAARLADADNESSSMTEAIRRNIDSAVQRFHIFADVAEVRTKAAANGGIVSAKLSDDDFAILYRDDSGKVVGREFPMLNEGEVKAAASKLLVDRCGPPFEVRRDAADRILKKAEEFGVDLDDDVFDKLERTSGAGVNTREAIADFMRKRAAVYSRFDEEIGGDLMKAAEAVLDPRMVYDSQFLSPSQLSALAVAIDHMDRMVKRGGEAIRELPVPDDVLFRYQRSKLQKFAAEHVNLGGAYYRRVDLLGVEVDRLRDLVGDVFSAKVAADGRLVDVSRLAKLLDEPGIDGVIDRAMFAKASAVMGIKPVSPMVLEPTMTTEVLKKIASRLPDGRRSPKNLDEL